MMPNCDIEKLQREIKEKEQKIKTLIIANELEKKDCKILVKKLLEAKPELSDWIEKNFSEYL